MRSSGATYRKLKEVKFRHLVELYRKYLKKSPLNCRYNQRYVFLGNDEKEHEIRLCMIHQDPDKGIAPHLLDVCQTDSDCVNCDGFIPKYTKDEIKEIFEQELSKRKIKEAKYPDICALEWVLERSVVGLPPISWIQKLYFILKSLFLKNKIL